MYTVKKKGKEKEKDLSLMYIMYVDASNNTPSYTHIGLYVCVKSPHPMFTSHICTS